MKEVVGKGWSECGGRGIRSHKVCCIYMIVITYRMKIVGLVNEAILMSRSIDIVYIEQQI
jgi:hypothetical protein